MRSGRPPVVRPRGRAAPRFPVVTLLNRPRMLQLRTESAADYWPTHSTSHLNTVGMSSSSTAGCLTEATTTAAATTLLSGNLHSRRPTASQKTSQRCAPPVQRLASVHFRRTACRRGREECQKSTQMLSMLSTLVLHIEWSSFNFAITSVNVHQV